MEDREGDLGGTELSLVYREGDLGGTEAIGGQDTDCLV